MHEDELLAEYRHRYPQFCHVNHREWLAKYHAALKRVGWAAEAQGHGGYAVITYITRGRIAATEMVPRYEVGEIMVLEKADGCEVHAAGRARTPAKWGNAVRYYFTTDYSEALTVAIATSARPEASSTASPTDSP
jgi:hypothetical protein